MAAFGDLNVNIIKDSSDHTGMPLETEIEYNGMKDSWRGYWWST